MNPYYPAVAARANFRCEYCLAPEQVFNFALDVEHIHPRAAGGDNAEENLALACESCNLFKADAVGGDDEVTEQFVLLFHPRRDLWEHHFLFNAETREIIGLTAVGRVTATRLKMNSDFQLRARRHWISLGLYP